MKGGGGGGGGREDTNNAVTRRSSEGPSRSASQDVIEARGKARAGFNHRAAERATIQRYVERKTTKKKKIAARESYHPPPLRRISIYFFRFLSFSSLLLLLLLILSFPRPPRVHQETDLAQIISRKGTSEEFAFSREEETSLHTERVLGLTSSR